MIKRWFPWLFPKKGIDPLDLAIILAKAELYRIKHRAALIKQDWEEASRLTQEYANEVPKASG